MLWLVVSSIYLWFSGIVYGQASSCPLLGKTPATQTGENNFVLDWFFGVLVYPFAIGQCTSTSFESGSYSMYTCHQNGTNWYVSRNDYTSSSCSGTPLQSSTKFVEGEVGYGDVGYFKCDGVNSYAEVKIAISACAGLQTTFAALGACALNHPHLTLFYCNGTAGHVQLFENATYLSHGATTSTPNGYCQPNLYCDRWPLSTSSCQYIATALGNKLYGQLITCNLAGSSTTSTTKKSAPVQFAPLFSIIFVLAVSLFSFR